MLKNLASLTILFLLHIHCNAQDIINIKIGRAMKLTTLPGTWNFLIKSTDGGDTMNFNAEYSYNFLNTGAYYHTEKGQIVESGYWTLTSDTLILSNRVWHVGAGNNSLVLDKTEKIFFTDKKSFFLKITKNKTPRIIMFKRRTGNSIDFKSYNTQLSPDSISK